MTPETMLQKFFAYNATGDILFPFLLCVGGDGMTTNQKILASITTFLSNALAHDLLYLKDYSLELTKLHTLKIQKKTSEQTELLQKTYGYDDKGMREAITRLSRSPFGNRKVLFLENMQRMTTESANALLKSCEEPLEGRLICGSVASIDDVLPTLVSRAFIINFDQNRSSILDAEIQSVWTQRKNFIGPEHVVDRYHLLQTIHEGGNLQDFFHLYIQEALAQKQPHLCMSVIQLQKYMVAHVQIDALLLELAMQK